MSGDNLDRFVKLYGETISYTKAHPSISINIQKIHYFVIDCTDTFGNEHRIVKTEDSEVDPEHFDEIVNRAKTDSNDKAIEADDSTATLENIVRIYLKNEVSDF